MIQARPPLLLSSTPRVSDQALMETGAVFLYGELLRATAIRHQGEGTRLRAARLEQVGIWSCVERRVPRGSGGRARRGAGASVSGYARRRGGTGSAGAFFDRNGVTRAHKAHRNDVIARSVLDQ